MWIHQDFDAGINIKGFSDKSFPTGAKFSSETFLEEIKPAVIEKYQIEYRQKSKKSIFGGVRIKMKTSRLKFELNLFL